MRNGSRPDCGVLLPLTGFGLRRECLRGCHPSAYHLLEYGHDIRTVQGLLRHQDVETTMIYNDVLHRGDRAVRSPLDRPGPGPSGFFGP